MVKVLIISDATLDGGTNTYIFGVIKTAIIDKNYDINLLLDDNENMVEMARKCERLGVNVYREKIYHGTQTPLHIRNRIGCLINKINPDVTHVFCSSIRSAITIREAIIEHNIPLFSTETYVSKDYPITLEELGRVHQIYAQTRTVVAVSFANIKVLREFYELNPNNIICIPTSIDTSNFQYKERRIDDHINAVVIGRLSKQKGIDLLIEAFNNLKRRYRDKYSIDIYGDGEMKQEIIEMIKHYGLEKYIHLNGWVNNINNILENYNLGIVPSRDEGLPNVVLELLLCGIPTIVSDVEGILEATDSGYYAEVFQSESVSELTKKLIAIINSPSDLLIKNKEASDYIRTHYNMDINYAKYLKLWKDELIDRCQ